MEEVRVLASRYMIWRSNADMDWEDECLAEFNKLGRAPPVIIATQKIAVGADLPNVRGVVLLNARFAYDKMLVEQILGRVDRERAGRYTYVEQDLCRTTSENSILASNTSIHNLAFNRQTRPVALQVLTRLFTDRAVDKVLIDFVTVYGQRVRHVCQWVH